MGRIILRRLATSVPTIFATTVLVFALRYLLPGGPVQAMLGGGQGGQYTGAQLAALKARLGLNAPVPVQYWHWLVNAAHGDLGTSYYSQAPVTQVIGPRVGPSLELIIGALILSVVVGGGLGVLAAVRRNTRTGRAISLATGLGLSVPDFWLATIAAGVLGLTWQIFPAVGYTPVSQGLLSNLNTVALPIIVLSIVTGSFLARHVNSAMITALESPYIRAAWAMGLPGPKVYLNCALRNAVAPVITFIPLAFAALVGGTVLVENIFAIPGMGTEIVSSVSNEDFPVVQAIVLLVGVLVAVLNLGADVGLALIDPRIRNAASE
ncbi:ABC transporter permease [Acidiferrimicrobium sp. IK]|uniref:ABC transporter permease n=1 Tax=Acidiferrimicrobium sp. IK TaxID=2871700 RepID=UPI0021CB3F07|nr:ABC transporter permease [Acidiferrimicrobium sp. IK]MCU4186673.1 ABC transporter permease [Acidiferrimicrobium sp. IK]